jgi:hypothetical protein
MSKMKKNRSRGPHRIWAIAHERNEVCSWLPTLEHVVVLSKEKAPFWVQSMQNPIAMETTVAVHMKQYVACARLGERK